MLQQFNTGALQKFIKVLTSMTPKMYENDTEGKKS